MQNLGQVHQSVALETLGLKDLKNVYWNLSTPELYEEAVKRGEGRIAHDGPLVVRTGQYTGRSANDKFVVEDEISKDTVWWGKHNQKISSEKFEGLYRRMLAYAQGHDLFVQDCFAGADSQHRLSVRILTQHAWHSLFIRNMLIQAKPTELEGFEPQFTVLQLPDFRADPELDGTKSETFIILNFTRKLVLIGGTQYAGEIKKSVFTYLNYLLPQLGVLSMHASANVGEGGDVAVFFGLSGTGKTTLSADPARRLIGDDEHGWSEDGIFNFEGGCYAKVIKLSPTAEPEIFATTKKFGTVLENVVMDSSSRVLDLDDSSLTENTRSAYPLSHIPNIQPGSRAGHPRNVVMLTADAFGVLPPLARLTAEQAMYYFLSGYTAKVAGTERGVTEPSATFSPCFGAPFMSLPPAKYAALLGDKLAHHDTRVWLVNTGWTGGAYGTGKRMSIGHTRILLAAALEGKLEGVTFRKDPTFGLEIPLEVPGIPAEILDPRKTWADPDAYDRAARDLAGRFRKNFLEFEKDVSGAVKDAGPALEASEVV